MALDILILIQKFDNNLFQPITSCLIYWYSYFCICWPHTVPHSNLELCTGGNHSHWALKKKHCHLVCSVFLCTICPCQHQWWTMEQGSLTLRGDRLSLCDKDWNKSWSQHGHFSLPPETQPKEMFCSTHVQLDTHNKRKSSKSQKVGCYTHFEFYQPAKSVVIPPADMAHWHLLYHCTRL